jgi:hypothetical protein
MQLGDFRMALVVVLMAVIIVALSVEILRLRGLLYDKRWTEAKIIPLMRDVSKIPPEDREYLDPEILRAFTRGDLTLDQAIVLTEQPAPHS